VSALARVVWSEGMHLAQHHFQAQSRYFEELISHTVSSLFFRPYGLVGVQLDAEALLNGTVSVTHARGVLPDGLIFNVPVDGVPSPLAIRDLFSPTQDSHLVLLGIPAFQANRSNLSEPDTNVEGTRFVSTEAPILDEVTGLDEKKVGIARKNFRLLLDYQATPDLVTMPLARVRRDGSGHFIYDPDYIPPTLQVAASRRLLELVDRLVGILEAKADALIAERSGAAGAFGERGSREVASFWLSHAVHSSIAPLRHHLRAGEAHPEELYLEMARLAGALCTFSMTSHPRAVPAYDHDKLDECFGLLDRHIRDHLGAVIPTNCITIPLQSTDTNLYTARVADRRCLDRARWYLGIQSSAATASVLTQVPKLVKVCSVKHIVRLVREAYPGLSLEHVSVPPSEIPVRAGSYYFNIQQTGPCWTSIVDTAEVGVYIPDAIPDAKLELLVVLGS
jgi:type VI secretion system protein ImpJ